MKRLFLSLSLALFIAFSLSVATARPAYGYVDPGSGFLAVQTIASVAAAFGYFLRRRIAAFFGKKEAVAVSPTLQKGSQSSTK